MQLWRPFWDYSNYMFSKKQLWNIQSQITSSEGKKLKWVIPPHHERVCHLLLQILTLLNWVWLHEEYPPERMSCPKTTCMKSIQWSSKDDFLLQKPLNPLGQKEKVQLPHDSGRHEKGFGLAVGYPCRFYMMKQMCNGWKNLTLTTFFPWWYLSFVLLWLQFVAIGLGLWLKQDLLTNPKWMNSSAPAWPGRRGKPRHLPRGTS